MSEDRIHRATSADGTEIAGRIHGQGPPLVLVHGALGDGEVAWDALLPYLTDRFTCHSMSLRGRGLSGPNPDLSRARLIQDVTAYVDSVGEPVGMVGLSSGGLMSLAAAENSEAVSGVAAYEPPAFEVITDEVMGEFRATVGRMAEAAEEGRLADAAQTFVQMVTNDDEFAAIDQEFFDALGENVPVQLEEFPQVLEAPGLFPTHPSLLAKIDVPVLLMHGTRSYPDPWMMDSVRHVAEHVADIHVREFDGAGHLAPIVEPERVADEIVRFFSAVRQAA